MPARHGAIALIDRAGVWTWNQCRRGIARSEVAPAEGPIDGQSQDRPFLEALDRVLLVLPAEAGDGRSVLLPLMRLGLEELTATLEAEPGELRPVLRPAVDQERRLRQDEQVADAAEIVRVGAALRLLVERAVEPRRAVPSVVADDEADRDEPRPARRSGRGQRRRPGRVREGPLRRRQDRDVRHSVDDASSADDASQT